MALWLGKKEELVAFVQPCLYVNKQDRKVISLTEYLCSCDCTSIIRIVPASNRNATSPNPMMRPWCYRNKADTAPSKVLDVTPDKFSTHDGSSNDTCQTECYGLVI